MDREIDGLLRAVYANWEDDAPKLIMCDWLEERERITSCIECSGSGKILDNRGFFFDFSSGIQRPHSIRIVCPVCNGFPLKSNHYPEYAKFIRLMLQWHHSRIVYTVADEWHIDKHRKGMFRSGKNLSLRVNDFFFMNEQYYQITEINHVVQNDIAWYDYSFRLRFVGVCDIDQPLLTYDEFTALYNQVLTLWSNCRDTWYPFELGYGFNSVFPEGIFERGFIKPMFVGLPALKQDVSLPPITDEEIFILRYLPSD